MAQVVVWPITLIWRGGFPVWNQFDNWDQTTHQVEFDGHSEWRYDFICCPFWALPSRKGPTRPQQVWWERKKVLLKFHKSEKIVLNAKKFLSFECRPKLGKNDTTFKDLAHFHRVSLSSFTSLHTKNYTTKSGNPCLTILNKIQTKIWPTSGMTRL